MRHTITLIPGDGIGPEVTDAVVRILSAAGVSIDWAPIWARTWPCSKPCTAPRRTSPARASRIRPRLLLSAVLMLDHIGEDDAAERIRRALDAVLRDRATIRTRDLGGTASTTEFADAVVHGL